MTRPANAAHTGLRPVRRITSNSFSVPRACWGGYGIEVRPELNSPVNSGAHFEGADPDGTWESHMGLATEGGWREWDGAIDELAVFQRAVPEAEAQAHLRAYAR